MQYVKSGTISSEKQTRKPVSLESYIHGQKLLKVLRNEITRFEHTKSQ